MKNKLPFLYIIFWLMYTLQGILYARGGVLSRLLMALIITISGYYLFELIRKYKISSFLKKLLFLVFLWTVYGAIIIAFDNGIRGLPSYIYLKNIYVAILPIFVFYYLTKEGYYNESTIRILAVLLLIVSLTNFNTHYDENLARAIDRGSAKEEFTNNKAYMLVAILPLLPLFKKQIIKYILFGICLLYIILGMKRGAILSGGLCSLWFLYNSLKEGKRSGTKVWKVLLTVAIIVGVVFVIQKMLLTSDYFVKRVEVTAQGDSSGRNNIYLNYFSFFINQTSIVHFLFGNGADATVRLLHQYAHNDWLEIAINNGLFGVVLYGIYWISFFKYVRKTRAYNRTYYLMLSMFFIIYFTKSLYSMSYNSIPISASLALGFASAKFEQERSALTNTNN